MRAFRLVRKKYANPLSGEGASRSGNRWNSKGTALIYCADSRALAMAEVAVHLSLGLLPKDYEMVELEIPDEVSLRLLAVTTTRSRNVATLSVSVLVVSARPAHSMTVSLASSGAAV